MKPQHHLNKEGCLRDFGNQRSILSHDLLHNEFFMQLGPAWHDGRLGADDAVFHGLLGDLASREQVTGAIEIWKKQCSPVFRRLSEGAESVFGFVVTEAWKAEVPKWIRAVNELDGYVIPPSPLSKIAASQEALRFWTICDVIKDAVSAWRVRFSEFFADWDGSLIRDDETP